MRNMFWPKLVALINVLQSNADVRKEVLAWISNAFLAKSLGKALTG
jgi:hypothetical protein